MMNTWNKVEELMEFVKTHDIKELKDSGIIRKKRKAIPFFGFWR